MKAIINFGKIAYSNPKLRNNLVEIEMRLETNSKNKNAFTASGLVWNSKRTDIIAGGQCLDTIKPYLKGNELYNTIFELWKKHHLNDMNSGSEEQEKLLKDFFKDERYDYKKAVEYLKSINKYEFIYENEICYYGKSWYHREIPIDDLNLIKDIITKYSNWYSNHL
jgi:hypothetical protein